MNESAPQALAARPAVVTEDRDLLDQILRLCAAGGVTPDLANDSTGRRHAWACASMVLVGDDQASTVARLGLSRRDNVVLVSLSADRAAVWRLAVELRADQVVFLPEEQQRLIDCLADAAEGGDRARTVGVVGGCGGAGASTTAAGLALTAARAGRSALLLDIDPLGGGIDLVLGCEDVPGVRWPEVVTTRGRVGAHAFRSALPRMGALPVLSWDRTGPRATVPAVMQVLLGAAQRGSELVVVDLPRRLDEAATQAMAHCDTLLLLVPTEVRAVAAARCLLTDLRAVCADVRVVVRVLPRSVVTAAAVTDALDLPLAGRLPTQRGLVNAVNDGLGPLGRRGFERACRGLLAGLA